MGACQTCPAGTLAIPDDPDVSVKHDPAEVATATVNGTFCSGDIEGAWLEGNAIHVITGSTLLWEHGGSTSLVAVTSSSFYVDLGGETYQVVLQGDGERLVWNDGQIWTRAHADSVMLDRKVDAAPAVAASADPTPATICSRQGCSKPTWNGKAGEYCSRTCRAESTSAPSVPLCLRPHCGKPTWNGKPGEFCGRTCRGLGAGAVNAGAVPAVQAAGNADVAAGDAPTCLRQGCSKPTWNGLPNAYCSKSCRPSVAPVVTSLRGTEVDVTKFADIQQQFSSKWKSSNPEPVIASIWFVEDPALVKKHADYCTSIGDVALKGAGRNPGNQQRRFHATKMSCRANFSGSTCSSGGCSACNIMRSGFMVSKAGASAGSLYGRGIYCSSTSSKAMTYGNVMFVVGVACGVADVSGSKGALPAGTHSRIVNNSNDECVVFNDSAMLPKYLILFK